MNKRTIFMLLLSFTLILASCAGGEQPEAADGNDSDNNGNEGNESELIIASDQDPVGLDPQKVPAASSQRIYSLVYNSLVTLDDDFVPQPELADKWDISPDGKTITFDLHEGVKFHNGREMTSEDVRFSYERILDPDEGSLYRSYFESIDTIETPSDYQVVFHLKTPDSAFIQNAASASIVPEEVEDLNTEALGTGPFILETIEEGQYVSLKRNPDYFKEDEPKVDAIRFMIMKDETERLAAIRSGSIHITPISPDSSQLLEGADNVSVKDYQSLDYYYFGMNVNKAPFDDPKVRQAISYTVDREAIIDTVWKGHAVLSGPVSPAQTSWALDVAEYPDYEPDLDKARQLLAEAGYADGFDMVIQSASTYPEMMETAQLIQSDLQAIGISAEIEQLEWGTYVDTWSSKDMETMVGYNGSGRTPDRSLRFFFSTEGSANVWNYSNPDLDQLVQDALQEIDDEKRKQIYDQAQRLVAEEVPNLFLVSPKRFYAATDDVEGFEPSAAGESRALLKTSLK